MQQLTNFEISNKDELEKVVVNENTHMVDIPAELNTRLIVKYHSLLCK